MEEEKENGDESEQYEWGEEEVFKCDLNRLI